MRKDVRRAKVPSGINFGPGMEAIAQLQAHGGCSMTKEESLQRTSRGETFGELLRRALADWQTPASVEASMTEIESESAEISAKEEKC